VYTPIWSTNPDVAFKALAPSHLQPPKDWPDWKTGEINLIERPVRERWVIRLLVRPLLALVRRKAIEQAAQASPCITPREVIGGAP
jgi:hypothetical protein